MPFSCASGAMGTGGGRGAGADAGGGVDDADAGGVIGWSASGMKTIAMAGDTAHEA